MNMSQITKMRWVLFWVFVTAFIIIVLSTLSMIFFGFGQATPEERSLLFKVFIGEIGVSIVALFYSLFGLKPKAEEGTVDAPLIPDNSLIMANEELSKIKQESIDFIESKFIEIKEQTHTANLKFETFSQKLEQIERLIVLPNYEIPGRKDLWTIKDIENQIKGKRVLVKLDIDIPIADVNNNPIDHYKFKRAISTLNYLLDRQAKVIILAGQGLSSIDYLDKVSPKDDLSWHIEKLSSLLKIKVNFKKILNLNTVADSINKMEGNDVLVLPNLTKLSTEEVRFQKTLGAARSKSYIHEDLLIQALENSYDYFVLDDFRSTILALPSNVGLANNKTSVIGKGVESDLYALEKLIRTTIDLGRRTSSERVCICGSSRPNDLVIVAALLKAKLFDKILIGPYPSLVLHAVGGQKLSRDITDDISFLVKNNNYNLDRLMKNEAFNILDNFSEHIVLPEDYIVNIDGKDEEILATSLSEYNTSICGIGNATINSFKRIIADASLVFHFGMLGRSESRYIHCTKEIIYAYANSDCVSFMAGDHIAGIASLINVEDKIDHIITGAKTTSFYITGKHLPGLEPFIK